MKENRVVAERFIRNYKNKIKKYMTLTSKNENIDKLDDIFNEYKNTYYRLMKMRPTKSAYGTNDKNPKFKANDNVSISKYRNIFSKTLHYKLVSRSFRD